MFFSGIPNIFVPGDSFLCYLTVCVIYIDRKKKYHRNCRSVFTMKRDSAKIQKAESKVRVLLDHTVLGNNPTV